MNYYIDFIPNKNFLQNFKTQKENLIFNIYVKQIPAMNTNRAMYFDIKEAENIIKQIKEKGYKVNLMFDTFCFGNLEFSAKGKEMFKLLDQVISYGIDSVTITNHFFINYLRKKHPNCKIIISEYSEITNVQKINRFLNDIGADAVKIDAGLAKDIKTMEYIKEVSDINKIHIDVTTEMYENDIFRASFYNSLSHFIHEEKWEKVQQEIEAHQAEQEKLGNKKIKLEEHELKELIKLGYKNFWYQYNKNS